MDESVRLRRKDTTKGAPLRILCLDGGGIRGYSMLIILQELMHRTFVEIEGRAPQRHEIPKPCDHFDLIAGAGTGGLIALMLGRLRLDLDTCKDLYVRMTRRVFETDKTFAGIPLKSTMFKASKLEEAIRDVVYEHTASDAEGNDSLNPQSARPATPRSSRLPHTPTRSTSQSSRYSMIGQSPAASHHPDITASHRGNADALLYDRRENRTKTIVTAVLKGTTRNEFLRSYDSRKETAPDEGCTIWQAGRATAATHMAFKPIRIGQSIYLDEGAGKFNPSPEVLDEATINEWPGREVGTFVSIGTGKRPKSSNGNDHEWWEGLIGGTMGNFAEARRRTIRKLETCETTHEYMMREHLHTRNVNPENYYRLNVEVGVGEFGMNEWSRLAQISTNTRIYLATSEVERLVQGAAAKIAKTYFAKLHHTQASLGPSHLRNSWQSGGEWQPSVTFVPPPSNPIAVELPGDMGPMLSYGHQYHRDGVNNYDHRSSLGERNQDDGYSISSPTSMYSPGPGRTMSQNSTYKDTLMPFSHPAHARVSPRVSGESVHHNDSPPPRPPKEAGVSAEFHNDQLSHMSPASPTTVQHATAFYGPDSVQTFTNHGDLGRRLPYPDQKLAYMDGPPPSVNMQSKPQI